MCVKQILKDLSAWMFQKVFREEGRKNSTKHHGELKLYLLLGATCDTSDRNGIFAARI